MRKPVLAFAAAAILVVAYAPVGLATTTKIPFALHEVVDAELVPGEWTTVDGVLSARGAVWHAVTTGTPAIEGTDTVVLNFDLDLATGSGELWGTDRLEPTLSPGGGYDCTWHGKWVAFTWSGKAVCHGDGTLRGWQLRYTIVPAGDGYDLRGYYFLPSH
ncbi:MAG: hypothetical protein A2X23_08930 [Chloroflexi bacterium GWC2_73_18]|nr:MAG: hypothetical protein A2X23_08930 [Chloroflexi bacterium GWC2_73_18]